MRDIRTRLFRIISELFDKENDTNNYKDIILHSILSDSSQALEFVCFIEDEFEIEFEDYEVDIYFFSSFEHIENLIKKHL